jgi:spore maturation protein CgeB
MNTPLNIVVLGLSLSSSWGNGHATTWRALIRGLDALGHRVLFLERDVPWYAANRDLPDPKFCDLALYGGLDSLRTRYGGAIARADAVIVGSYVPDGIAVLDLVLDTARGVTAFYDIDTPITLASLDGGDPSYIDRCQIPRLDAYFSFAGGPSLARLEREHGARRALPLYCAVDARLYRPLDVAPVYDLGYLGTYSADRQPALERLLLEPARRFPDRRFVVAGPSYPPDIDWPANVERIEHVAPADHAAFYASQGLTLNVTRAAMRAAGWSPSVRLFEAAACGTPVVSDRWPGLESLFTNRESILIADDTDDVCNALALSPERRAAIGAAARAVVLADHTALARARRLVADLASLDPPRHQREAGTARSLREVGP